MEELKNLIKIEKGKKQLNQDRITVGLATCGISAGALKTYDKIKQELKKSKLNIKLEKVGCAGMCYAEPIVTVQINGTKSIYGDVTEDKVEGLIKNIKANKIFKDLFLGHSLTDIDYYKKQKRLLMENCGLVVPLNLEQYAALGGYQGLKNALDFDSNKVIEIVKASGLRGRGGAGFPTGLKWSFIAPNKGKKILVCNGDEGDPGAFMNRTVMESNPFKLIEGMTIAAYAIGSERGIIYTRAEYPLAIETLEEAIKIAKKHKLLGKDIFDKKGFNFEIEIKKGAGAFVCGEETALMNSVMGQRGTANYKPPFPAQKGIDGYPTNINNVGTLSHVSYILKNGAKSFTKFGTAKTTGTKVVCLTGKVKRSGVIEVPMGTTFKEIIFNVGGGMLNNSKFKAVQVGGPSGGCVTKKYLDLPLDYESLNSIGAIMGSGGVVVMNEDSCMVDVARYFMNFTAEESCGKCTPCREGTTRMLEILTKITKGLGTEKDLNILKTLAHFVQENALCGLGKAAPNPVLSTLRFFKNEYDCHINKKSCPAGSCRNLMKYIITNRCKGCGNCERHCPVNAISGKPKEKYNIDQSKCVKCGTCEEVCAFDAIDLK